MAQLEDFKKRIEQWLFLGYFEKEYDILGRKIKLKTLNQKENLDIDREVEKVATEKEKNRVYNYECLVKSILSVDGVVLTDEEKKEFVYSLQDPVVLVLLSCYLDLLQERDKTLGQLKNLQRNLTSELSGKLLNQQQGQ